MSSSDGGVEIAKVPQRIVSGFGNNSKNAAAAVPQKEEHQSPSSVFISSSHVSSRSNSFASTAGLTEEPLSPTDVGGGGVSYGGGGGGGAAGEGGHSVYCNRTSPMKTAQHRTRSVDDLLRDSVLLFHRVGPLVNPLGGQQAHAITGWHDKAAVSSTKDKMQFVAEVKGFDYGIFWRHVSEKTCFSFDNSVLINSFGGGGGRGPSSVGHSTEGLSLYIQSSMTMFATWITGFGMAGRVGHTGNYEWHEEVTNLPGWSFQRLRQAKNAALRTVICVPVTGGVVEFGSTRLHPHNLLTVQYVQKIMGIP